MSDSCKDTSKILIEYPESQLNCDNVKNNGACNTKVFGYPNPDQVRAMCPVSCGVKNRTRDVANPDWVRKIKLNCTTARNDGACIRKVNGYPTSDIVKTLCPVSCGVPVRKLEDQKNPGWKRERKVVTLTCQEVKAKGLCSKDMTKTDKFFPSVSEINKKCPKTCDSCFEINCNIPDKDKSCPRWAEKGECKSNPKYMFSKTYGCNCSCSKWCYNQIKQNTKDAEYCKTRQGINDQEYSFQG